jgi:hypothetical protein
MTVATVEGGGVDAGAPAKETGGSGSLLGKLNLKAMLAKKPKPAAPQPA